VLIEGETGTGKEVLAGMIHRLSPRAGAPFVKIDCSAIPRELLESELFGHERGAFTGAVAGHAGRFEQAQGGTVFLDEVGNLPVEIQMKLLNVLQDRSVQRVGGTRPMALDIRIIAATNVPLKDLTGQGRFRLDLYYRLNQCRIEIPPLRLRKDDVPLLAEYFLRAAAKNYGKDVRGFDRAAMALLYGHEWPGNVRELSNTVNRAVIFARGPRIGRKDIALEKAVKKAPAAAGRRGGPRQKWSVGKGRLSAVLKAHNGNISRVMAALGVSRPMVYKFIHRYKIRINHYRKAKK
jgi:DNA-binding NtrC family response regulator